MNDILASSKVGYDSQNAGVREIFWSVRPSDPHVRVTVNPLIYASYKSKTIRSDGRRPTDYTRMISRLSGGGPVEAHNRTYNVRASNTIGPGIIAVNLPHGSSIASGRCQVPAWMTDKVILDASAEMNQLGANILEDLGQLKQTGELVSSIVRLIYDLYQACLRGNWKAVRRRLAEVGSNVPKSVANGWLMYFYGIRPLVSTIDALTQAQQPVYRTLTVRKRVNMLGNPSSYVAMSSSYQCSGTARVYAQCELSASVKMSGNMHTWTQLGLTGNHFSDAVVTAWALVPYSFVFDWFIPVEAWLRTLVWSPALVYQGGFTGARHKVEATLTQVYPWSASGGPYEGILMDAHLKCLFYSRRTHPYVVPSASLGVRLGLNPTQIISASALITIRG